MHLKAPGSAPLRRLGRNSLFSVYQPPLPNPAVETYTTQISDSYTPLTAPRYPNSHVSKLQQSPSSRATQPGLNQTRLIGSTRETYVSYGMTQKIFEACSRQADYKVPQASQKGAEVPKTATGEDLGVSESWWYKDLGLPPTFSTWSQVTFLHMYLVTVRLRTLPVESLQTHSRHLIDHFSHNAEQRMDMLHGLTSRAIRNKYLKDLFIQWRGVLAAYDEGLVKGDAVLGAAVWRNLWKASHTEADGGDVNWAGVARVVAYMRRVLVQLDGLNEGDLVFDLSPEVFGYREVDKRLVESKR